MPTYTKFWWGACPLADECSQSSWRYCNKRVSWISEDSHVPCDTLSVRFQSTRGQTAEAPASQLLHRRRDVGSTRQPRGIPPNA